jgi:hypothetical protein
MSRVDGQKDGWLAGQTFMTNCRVGCYLLSEVRYLFMFCLMFFLINLSSCKLIGINQVYCWRYKSKTHKHYNFLQSLLKWKVYTKIIKMPSWKTWVQSASGLIKAEGSTIAFKGSYLVKGRESGIEVDVHNKS